MTLPDLDHLSHFVRVAETGSLTQAAFALDVSTSVLSRNIQQLERSLGQRLLQRTGRGMTLTENGRALLPRAQALLADAVRFTEFVKSSDERPAGRVIVGLPGSIAALIAGPLFGTVQQRYPSISIRLFDGLSGVIEELMASGRIDIALHYGRQERARRGEIALAISDLCLVGPPGDKLTRRARVPLRALEHCTLALPHAFRALVDAACLGARVDRAEPLEVDSLTTMKAMVEAGGCHTVCTYDAVAKEVQTGRLQAALIVEPTLPRLLVMSLASKRSLTIAARVVAGTIQELVKTAIVQRQWRARLP